LGCDGIPFSIAPCPSLSLITGTGILTNVTFVGKISATISNRRSPLIPFLGSNPSPSLLPGNSTTGQSDPNGVLEVHFESLREIRPDGSVVVEYLFDNLPFLLTSNSLVVRLFLLRSWLTQQQGNERVLVWEYFFSESSASIVIDETYYSVGQNISNAGIEYPVYDQSLKISIQISNWPFEGNLSSRTSLHAFLLVFTHSSNPLSQRMDWN